MAFCRYRKQDMTFRQCCNCWSTNRHQLREIFYTRQGCTETNRHCESCTKLQDELTTKNNRIKELENEKNELADNIEKINDKCVAIRRRNEKRIAELDRLRASIHVSLIAARAAVVKGGEVTEELLTELIDELSPNGQQKHYSKA